MVQSKSLVNLFHRTDCGTADLAFLRARGLFADDYSQLSVVDWLFALHFARLRC